MAESLLPIEVVYASPGRQVLVSLQVPAGCTARQAVLQSGLERTFAQLDLANAALGIFGKVVGDAQVLEAGDRVEIYRPLLADPKEVRKRRAAQAAGRSS